MAKYRITSIPQSLPKAQLGLFKNKKRNNNQQTAPQENWSGVTPELIQPGQNPFELEPTYVPTAEFTQSQVNLSNTLNKILEERQRLAQEKYETKYADDTNKYYDKFFKSKKQDKIEPFQTLSSDQMNRNIPVVDDEGNPVLDENGKPLEQSFEDYLKKDYLINKTKDGSTQIFPKELVYNRIVNNGFQAEQFKNIWGLDPKQVESQLGDIMKVAKDQYSSTMQANILKKAGDENISIEEAAKKLTSDRTGNLNKYVQPTKDALNKYIETIKSELDEPQSEALKSMYFDNRDPNATYSPKINYNSANPALEYNMDYYNTTGNWGEFLKNYSDYNKEYNKAYNKSVYNKQNQNADRFNLPVSDTTADLKNQLDLTNQNISLTKQIGDASTDAASKTINKNFIEAFGSDLSKVTGDYQTKLLKEKLDAVKNNPAGFSELMDNLSSGNAFTDEEQTDLLNFGQMVLGKGNTVFDRAPKFKAMYDTSDGKLTTSEKIFDILTNPFDAFKASNQGGINNLWDKSGRSLNERKLLEQAYSGSDYGTDKNNLVGDLLNTWNPMRFARDVDADIDRGDYASAGLEGLAFTSPAIFNTALKGARSAMNANKLLSLNRVAPGTRGFIQSGFNAMNPYFAYEALRPGGNFNKAADAFREGNIGEGLKEGAFGVLGVSPMLRVPLSYQTPGGKTFGLGNVGSQFEQGLQYAPNAKTFKQVISPSLKKDYYALSQQIHPDKFAQFGPTAERAALAQMQNLKDIYSGEQFMSIPFNQNLQIGRMQPKYSFNMGRLGQLNYGQNVFKPMSLQEMVTGTPKVVTTSPHISNQISFNKGGYLPKAQPGGIKKAVDLASSTSSIISSLRNLPSTFSAIAEGGNLFKNLWTNPINNALMNSAYESLAEGLYKNQSIQPLTDMLGSISNTDAKYLLTDALNQTDNPYEDLSNLMSNVDVDYSNIGDFNRNTLDFANRRGHAQKLLDLGYVGDEVTPLDLYKMARTNDSMNTITRNAIDFDRTGYRQVQGQLKPIGNLQDGYGPRGQFQYDMRTRASGAPRSEFENMDLRGVDKSNPLSIAEYQATSIPMEQYGYRAGVPDMSQQDALYLTSLPTRQSYGPYQFKIKQDLDLSGNWKDWMQKYVYDKPTLHLNANRENDLSKIYFNIGSAKGVPGRASDPLTNVARGTGLHTRQWISGKGNQIGSIDPTFRFTDLKNMSAEDYLDMEREKEGLIKLFNTGWRGQYKKGGVSMKLSKKEIDKYIKDGYIIEDE